MKIATKTHKSARESGMAALAAVTPSALRGGNDYESWPETAATTAELTMCLSGCLRASRSMNVSGAVHFDVERMTGDSYLVTGSTPALAEMACIMLDEAGFDVRSSGAVVLAKADKSKKDKKGGRGNDKVSAETKKKLVKTAARDMDVLKDAWSMKVAQRLFQEHVGAGDNFVAFMRFIDDLDNLLRKYRDAAGKDDEDGDDGDGKEEPEHDGDPAEASAGSKGHVTLTEEAAEELANVLLEIGQLYDAPLAFRVE